MSENKIELKSVGELLEMKFFIPSYQRGYRWTEQQVKDLLNDIDEFRPRETSCGKETWYCLQPLVVKKMDENDKRLNDEENKTYWYEVIDGQQRLTTIFIIFNVLNKQSLSIKYQTRSNSKKYLMDIAKKTDETNIDFFFMGKAKEVVNNWRGDTSALVNKLENYCKVIWYETDEKDPIKVFTRLNIGQISLTNAELIKALFLNRSNFDLYNSYHLRLRQQEIASEWDSIEYTLQNDEFWLFLHEINYNRPTRIDFIFDLICEQNSLNLSEEIIGTICSADYRTFRYFYEYFKQTNAEIESCWAEVKRYFQIFQEWFNDLELYHYVGYLVENKQSLVDLTNYWRKSKTKAIFINELKNLIKDIIDNCKDLNKQYEISGPSKTQCRPLLLLHNIQTIINQNKDYLEKQEYELPVFYKFPFHLFKKENWDVEHIDSNTENDMSDKKSQNEFLLNIYHSVDSATQMKIADFINDSDANDFAKFKNYSNVTKGALSTQEKNQIWNFTLLDSSTNRSYGNAIFAAKRRIIIGKDRGIILPVPKIKQEKGKSMFVEEKEKKSQSAFIPPCTKNVFLKYYSPVSTNYNYWLKPDAEAYKANILETLTEFGVMDASVNNQIRKQ